MDSKLGIAQPNIEIVIEAPPLSSDHASNNISLVSNNVYYRLFVSGMLANFHAGYFRISFSLCAQVLLWKNLVQFTKFYEHHDEIDQVISPMLVMLPSIASTLLWSISLTVLLTFSLIYTLRCFHHLDKVKEEFLHDVGVNYLFAPWMSSLFLIQTLPFDVPKDNIYLQILCGLLMLPIIMLDMKIYGQWFTKGKRFLSKMANPTCQISVVANLVAAQVAIYMGWLEVALCLFSVGMAHYLVLFVTLYQRLPGSNRVSLMLRPTFFLFIATPSMASLAWSSVTGTFDNASKMLFFLSVFLFMSLVARPTMFKKSMRRFNIAWWAYSFPLTLLALASIEYAKAVNNGTAETLALVLSVLSVLVSLSLIVLTSTKFNKLFLVDTKLDSIAN